MSDDNMRAVIDEFQWLSARLNSPAGLMRLVNLTSEAFSLRLTIVLQQLGVNRNLSQRYIGRKIIFNIGCGDALYEDCINADIAPTFGGILRLLKGEQSLQNRVFINILYSDKHLKGIADGVVFSHVLEHLPPHLAIPALLNIKNFLKPGGILRISVPDLGLYDQPDIPKNQQLNTAILAKNSLIYGWGHRFMYDADLLKKLLDYCGFKRVHQVLPNEGPLGHTDFDRRKGETVYLVAYA